MKGDDFIAAMKATWLRLAHEPPAPPVRLVSKTVYDEIVRDYDGSWELWMAAQYEKAEKRERPGS